MSDIGPTVYVSFYDADDTGEDTLAGFITYVYPSYHVGDTVRLVEESVLTQKSTVYIVTGIVHVIAQSPDGPTYIKLEVAVREAK